MPSATLARRFLFVFGQTSIAAPVEAFVAMLFCQLGQAHSLREIHGGRAATEGKLKHLGLSAAPKRSTLSYANGQRPWQLFETVW